MSGRSNVTAHHGGLTALHPNGRSDFAIHLTADIFGEADALLSMTHLRCAAEGGRTQISLRKLRKLDCVAIIDQSDPLAILAAKR